MNVENQKKIVVIGGGIGLSVILRGLKKKNLDINVIVTVADDGGSSGRLRADFDMLPPGDIRNVLISLANTGPLLEELLQYRFKKGTGLEGHNLGNLLIAALQDITGDFSHAINEASRILAIKGQVIPASLQKITLFAEYDDGTIIKGESNIPKVNKKIRRVYIEPSDAKPLVSALTAVKEADAIIMGPGSLYTSIIPNILVKELREAILDAKGKKIFICNIMSQPGETDGYNVSDHVNAVENHMEEQFIEYIIVNNEEITLEVIERYYLKGALPVRIDDEILTNKYKVIEDKFLKYGTYLRHDEEKVAECILKILK